MSLWNTKEPKIKGWLSSVVSGSNHQNQWIIKIQIEDSTNLDQMKKNSCRGKKVGKACFSFAEIPDRNNGPAQQADDWMTRG